MNRSSGLRRPSVTGAYERHGLLPVQGGWYRGRSGLSPRVGAEDFLKLFAIDEFGKVEVRADQIGRIDFVADITEEVDAPALP